MIQVNDFNILSHDFTTATTTADEEVSENEPRFSINFERQFLYMVRHNPTGLIVTIGRYDHPDSNEEQHQHHHPDEHHEHDHHGEHDHEHQSS